MYIVDGEPDDGVTTPMNYSESPFAHIARGEHPTISEKPVICEKASIAEMASERDELLASEDVPVMSKRRLWLALAGLDALLFIAALDLTIIATVYVEVASSFNALTRAEWTVTSYMLAATATQPLYGKFSDILGRSLAIAFAVAVFLGGSVMCALSQSMDMLVASRAVQGLGGGGIMALIFVVVADVLSERERGRYIGVFTCTWGLASAVAPVLGGVIVQRASWRWIFWLNLPVCTLALVLVLFFMRLPKPRGSAREKAGKIDVLGTLAFLGATLPLLLGLSWGGREHAWSSPLVLGCVLGGLAGLGVFALVEVLVAREPIVPPRLLRHRNVALSAVGHFFYGAAAYGPIVFVPQWALLVRGADAISAGMRLLPFTAGTVVTSVGGGLLMTRTGRYRRLLVLGSLLLALGNGLFLLFTEQTGQLTQALVLVLCGLGAGAVIQPLMMAAQAAVPGHDMAAATTLCAFLRSLGGIICVAVLSSLGHSVVRTGLTRLVVAQPKAVFVVVQVAENQAAAFAPGVPDGLRAAIVRVFARAMHVSFIALLPFGALLLLVCLGFEHVELHRERKQTIEQ
ncbi:hypothetical protein LPJ53_005222 [Coemansia erecta]|uniref:Major facilitator superfamily (MFS) profile domain-containing protein n=1 Tax=Coemansia erecta TaxID=147472 RepID=A0A9W7XW85_9FUNG|nr:hypothetical protein LPJ53_005222 [Coemansia erecta]